MANWKKVIVSGSQAELAGITASALTTLPAATGEFQVLVTGSGGAFFVTGSNALAGSNQNLDAGAGIVITNNKISASVDDVSIEINDSDKLAVISGSIGTDQIADSLGTLTNNQFTGSFTGSFSGDGTNLTGVTGATTDESLSFGGGLSGSAFATFDGENAVTAQLKGHEDLTENIIVKWDLNNSKLTGSTITDNGINVTTTANLIVKGNATFGDDDTDKVTIEGDLIVNGTASFINQESLQIADKFILLNSGSSPSEGGGIVIGNTDGEKEGALFGVNNDLGSSGGRFGIKADFDAESTSFPTSLDGFMGLTSGSTETDPNAANATSDIMKEQGNIFISNNATNDAEIWIYA